MNKPDMTVAEARGQLQEWQKALEACSTGANYSIAGRSLTRQDVPTIRAEIQRWHTTVNALEQLQRGNVRAMGSQAAFPAPGSGGGTYGIIPQDLWEDGRY